MTKIIVDTANEREIRIYLDSRSCAELDRADYLADDENIQTHLECPVYWFARIKARVEGQGDGTLLMKRVCDHADHLKATIVNCINPYGRMNLEQLIQWFSKFGFDYVGNETVVRKPKSLSLKE